VRAARGQIDVAQAELEANMLDRHLASITLANAEGNSALPVTHDERRRALTARLRTSQSRNLR
jgi:hypothetical protein